jgi:hypothetical protein
MMTAKIAKQRADEERGGLRHLLQPGLLLAQAAQEQNNDLGGKIEQDQDEQGKDELRTNPLVLPRQRQQFQPCVQRGQNQQRHGQRFQEGKDQPAPRVAQLLRPMVQDAVQDEAHHQGRDQQTGECDRVKHAGCNV